MTIVLGDCVEIVEGLFRGLKGLVRGVQNGQDTVISVEFYHLGAPVVHDFLDRDLVKLERPVGSQKVLGAGFNVDDCVRILRGKYRKRLGMIGKVGNPVCTVDLVYIRSRMSDDIDVADLERIDCTPEIIKEIRG